MQPLCPVCAHQLVPYGTGGLTCAEGHAFTREQITRKIPASAVVGVAGKAVAIRPWVPGAVLGGLALLTELVRAVA